jgi:hypothetical protein
MPIFHEGASQPVSDVDGYVSIRKLTKFCSIFRYSNVGGKFKYCMYLKTELCFREVAYVLSTFEGY